MGDLMAILMTAAVFGVALGGLAWIAARVRRRGVSGGYSLMGVFDELWNPAAVHSRYEVVAQDEQPAPAPLPGDRPTTSTRG